MLCWPENHIDDNNKKNATRCKLFTKHGAPFMCALRAQDFFTRREREATLARKAMTAKYKINELRVSAADCNGPSRQRGSMSCENVVLLF